MTAVARTTHAVLAAWHGLAAVQNVFDVLASTNVAPSLRPVASKNLELVAKVTKPLGLPQSTNATLVAGAAAAEALAALGFARGAVTGKRNDLAFALSLALFGAFFIIDDALDDYDLGAKHRAISALLAASYAACR